MVRLGVLVSIIVPAFNTDTSLFIRCIDSIVNQKYQNYELLIVDSSTNDKLSSLISEKYIRYKNIFYFKTDFRNVAKQKNFAINHAKGDYVFFLDSDDFIEKESINNLVNASMSGCYDIVAGVIVQEYENDDIIKYIKPFYGYQTPLYVLAKDYSSSLCTGKLFKLNILKKVLFEEIITSEDSATAPYLYLLSKSYFGIKDVVYHYRIHKNSLSHILSSEKYLCTILVDYYIINNKFFNLFDVSTQYAYFTGCATRFCNIKKTMLNSDDWKTIKNIRKLFLKKYKSFLIVNHHFGFKNSIKYMALKLYFNFC